MLKVGIITFHRAINYGAVLQTVGLYNAIVKNIKNCEVEIIDYRNEHIERIYSPLYSNDRVAIKRILKILFFMKTKVQKRNKFNRFVEENVVLSAKYTKDNIDNIEKEYDIFFTGSDQVWHSGCAAFDNAYFLSPIKDERKINSYAASFGMEKLPEKLLGEYKERLARFNNISVREESAKKIIEKLLNREDTEVVLDPTLICEEEFWLDLASKTYENEEYIFLYTVNTPINLVEYAKKLSKETGYPIYSISDGVFNKDKEIKYLSNVSPQDFLGLIKDAKYVVTNSFHGTAFSIIFESDFWVELETNAGSNNRAKELLTRLGIKNRTINVEREILDKINNWDEIKGKLMLQKEKSLGYLKKVLE